MSRLDELKSTPEYAEMKRLEAEKEKLSNLGCLILLFPIGTIIYFISCIKQGSIEAKLEKYKGLATDIAEEERKEQVEGLSVLRSRFERTKYATGHIIVYGQFSVIKDDKLERKWTFANSNGHKDKDGKIIMQEDATIYIDGQPAMSTQKGRKLYAIPVSPGIHHLELESHTITYGWHKSSYESDPIKIDTTDESILFFFDAQCITSSINSTKHSALLKTCTYNDFAEFAADTGLRSLHELEQ